MSRALVPYVPRELTKGEQLQHIYVEVASGRSLNSVLSEDEGMPSKATFWRWHMADENIRDNLARARENGVEAILEEVRQIADTPVEAVEVEEGIGPKGPYRKRSIKEALGHRRLQIETRLKYAQMIAPRKYGVKQVDVHHEGEIALTRPSDELDDVTRATRLAALMQSLQSRIEASSDE